MGQSNDQSNEMPDELEREEDEARQLDQSTTERGDHSSFRPFEVEKGVGGEVLRHSEDRGEDQSSVENRVAYYDDEGNLIGFGEADQQPTEADEVGFIDIENLNDDEA